MIYVTKTGRRDIRCDLVQCLRLIHTKEATPDAARAEARRVGWIVTRSKGIDRSLDVCPDCLERLWERTRTPHPEEAPKE